MHLDAEDDFPAADRGIAQFDLDEFSLLDSISADTVTSVARAGFMPMATMAWDGIVDDASESGLVPGTPKVQPARSPLFILTPKLHYQRCLLHPAAAHITRTVRRESSRYLFSMNHAFDAVLGNCVGRHGDGWLVPDLVRSFSVLHSQRMDSPVAFVSAEVWTDAGTGEAGLPASPRLVAGEIGYLIGSVYASLTGYSSVSGAGSVQLGALGAFLAGAGVGIWDLGMSLGYKHALGGRVYGRQEFLSLLYDGYATAPDTVVAIAGRVGPRSAREIIDAAAPLRSLHDGRILTAP